MDEDGPEFLGCRWPAGATLDVPAALCMGDRANNYEARPMAVAQRPEVLLATDNKTVLLSLERDGKFSAKSAAWEENKVMLPGEELVIRVEGGR